MTRFNLGCGDDIRSGYTNCDFVGGDKCFHLDMQKFPWSISDEEAEEILLLDVLEHFPYSQTRQVLSEVWRVLKPDAFVDIQVPDFEECAKAMMWTDDIFSHSYDCNSCGHCFTCNDRAGKCPKCGQHRDVTAQAAMQRLYGGQDRKGNWHYAAFTKRSLSLLLEQSGFDRLEFKELNQNGETMRQNWNMYVRAYKKNDLW